VREREREILVFGKRDDEMIRDEEQRCADKQPVNNLLLRKYIVCV